MALAIDQSKGDDGVTSILNLVPEIIILFDLKHMRLHFVNDHAARVFGYVPGEKEAGGGEWVSNIFSKENLDSVLKHIGVVKRLPDGQSAELVCRCIGKGGEPLWIRFRDSIFKREEDGLPLLSLSLGTIVDAPSDAGMDWRRPDSLLLREPVAMFWECNIAKPEEKSVVGNVEELTGFKPMELKGDVPWLDLVEADHHPEVAALVRNSIEFRSSFDVECRFCRADGRHSWVRVTGIWRAPNILAGVILDIDARRAVQENLHSAAREARAFNTRLAHELEQEKTRNAQFLHDELGQLAVKVLLDIDWITERSTMDLAPGETYRVARRDIIELREDVALLLAAIRGESRDLLPAVLEQEDLPTALRWLGRLFERKAGLMCRFDFRPEALKYRLTREQVITLFRISQEAMTNVWKHAKARSVDMALTVDSGSFGLRIGDDGIGMSIANYRSCSSVGFCSMRERAKMIGARFFVDSSLGRGTQISVKLSAVAAPTLASELFQI